MKGKIYVTRKIHESGLLLLKKKCGNNYDIIINNSYLSPKRKEILRNIIDSDALLCTLSENIDKEVLRVAGKNLKVISTYSTGFEHIDIIEAKKRGIRVTNTGNVLSEATADLTFCIILSLARRSIEASLYVREKNWNHKNSSGWMPNLFIGKNVYNSTLGILGLGKIGLAVAKRAAGFNMKIIYNNRNQLPTAVEKKYNLRYVDINSLFSSSDFLSIHCDLNKDSFHLVNKEKINLMKSSAYIINTSRGGVIDESDLVDALKRNTIAGAGLDVFEKEPLKRDHKFHNLKNILLLPHIGSATNETRSEMSLIAAQNIINVLNDKEPFFSIV